MAHKITDLEVFWVGTPLPNPVSDATSYTITSSSMMVVRLTTNEGFSGYGMTFSMNIAATLAEFITRVLKPAVIGKDPMCNEVIWQSMMRAMGYAGHRGMPTSALSAVDIAVWDLKGRILGLPIFKMLGGENRMAKAYASGGWTSMSTEEMTEEAELRVSEGYSVIKIKVGVEGGANPREDVRRVEAVRRAVGDDLEIIVDANGIWEPATAIRFAEMIKDYDISVFEEPVSSDDVSGLRDVRRATGMAVGTGENAYTRFAVRELVTGEAVDVIQSDISRTGGFTEMQKISAITEAWNMRFAPHAWEFAGAHLLSAARHGLYLEKVITQEPIFKKVMFDYPETKNGFYEIPDKPGLGLEFDLDFLRRSNQL